MYGAAKFLIAFSLLAFPARAGVPRKADEKKPDKQKVLTRYDAEKDVTLVSSLAVVISEKTDAGGTGLPLPALNEGLWLDAHFAYRGQTFVQPEFITLRFRSVTKGKALYADGIELFAKTKDASTSLGKLTVENSNVSVAFPGRKIQALYQYLSLRLSREDFSRLVNEKSLTLLLGKTNVKLKNEDLKGLRELAARAFAAE